LFAFSAPSLSISRLARFFSLSLSLSFSSLYFAPFSFFCLALLLVAVRQIANWSHAVLVQLPVVVSATLMHMRACSTRGETTQKRGTGSGGERSPVRASESAANASLPTAMASQSTLTTLAHLLNL
jgi:hypothetical protein